MKTNIKNITRKLIEEIQALNYKEAPISDYNKQYIHRLLPALPYYMEIYTSCLLEGIKSVHIIPEEITLIDYGGGSGFLSMLAKRLGIGKVIYIDLNPFSVNTITYLKKTLNVGPDVILEGNSPELTKWCEMNNTKPHLLVATDLIEHVYDLKTFFADLIKVNSSLSMIFSTDVTPYNPIVKRRLRKMMTSFDTGTGENPNYQTLRYRFIKTNYPQLSEAEVMDYSRRTRGFIYSDIAQMIENKTIPIHPSDPYNTCDPATGNWAERILPICSYREILSPYHYTLKVKKGFYNVHRNNMIASFIGKIINLSILYTGKVGLLLAPFIIFSCQKKES